MPDCLTRSPPEELRNRYVDTEDNADVKFYDPDIGVIADLDIALACGTLTLLGEQPNKATQQQQEGRQEKQEMWQHGAT